MPKGERKKYTKEFKLNAVYMMLSKVLFYLDILEVHEGREGIATPVTSATGSQ